MKMNDDEILHPFIINWLMIHSVRCQRILLSWNTLFRMFTF